MLTAISLFQSVASVSCTEPTRPMPALLTRTSSRPKRSTLASTAACRLARSVTSVRRNKAASPSSWATLRPPSSLRSAITTRAPCSAKARQVAAPMPLPPPVTNATLPSSRYRATALMSFPPKNGHFQPMLVGDAQGLLDDREQLLGCERLDQVHVRLGARACLTVRLCTPAGEHDHRHIPHQRIALDDRGQLQSVVDRHLPVENGDRRVVLADQAP